MRKKRFIANVMIMSSSMLVIRIIGMISNIYISSMAGAESMGIYHMIFSVFAFGMTFSASGTGFAVTRLVSEERSDEKSILIRCLCISLVMSGIAFLFFFFFPCSFIQKFTAVPKAKEAMRILTFALPCMASSSVFRGYFIAKRKAPILTISSVCEEVICIGISLFLLKKTSLEGHMCLVTACTISNLSAFVIDSLLCAGCLFKTVSRAKKSSYRDIFSICAPIALGSYMRTALVAAENLLIPMQFMKYGTTSPVGEYGIIKAMAMPIVLFPTVFIQSFSSMLVPEMSEMNAKNRYNGIRYVSSLSLGATTMFAFFVSLMLFSHHEITARAFFKEENVGYYLGLLSLLAIPMYLDTVADSILKGLNLQTASLRYNIIDSVSRIFFIVFVVDKYGPVSYIAMLYLSEIFNLFLSLSKAARVTKLSIDFIGIFVIPFASALCAYFFKVPIIQFAVYVIATYTLKAALAKQRRQTNSI